MASERRTCAKGCGRRFSRPLGSRRVYCETCSPPRKRKLPAPPEHPPPEQQPPGTLELAALGELRLAGRVDTYEGVLWLRLSRDADQASGDKVARLIPSLLKAKDLALKGWKRPRPDDPVDELAARVARKAAEAS